MVPPTTLSPPPISPHSPSTVHQSPSPISPNATTIPYDSNEINQPAVHASTSELEGIYLSYDPFGPTTTTTIRVNGVHPTLGLELEANDTKDRLILRNCAKSTPAHKIKRWRSTLRHGNLKKIDDKATSTITDVKTIIEQARQQQKSQLTLTFATDE